MSTVMCLYANGDYEILKIVQEKVYTYFSNDSITFCGAIPSHNIVAICREKHKEQDTINKFSIQFDCFDETYGDILLVATDESGDECDIDVEKTKTFLDLL